MKTESYLISGMSCAACSASVQRVVSRLDGVKSCEVNLITGKMTVTYDEKNTGEKDFIRVVEKAGFGISREIDIKKQKEKPRKQPSSAMPLIISAILSAVLLYISMGQMLKTPLPVPKIINMNSNPYNYAITQLILTVPVLFIGRRFFTKGLSLLFRGHPNMDSLVAIGAGASFIYSFVMMYTISFNKHAVHNLYFESVAVVLTLIMLGKYFEQRSKTKTAGAIKKLMELSPDTAIVISDGREIEKTTSEIKVGDTVLVKPGAKIPLDGTVENGSGEVDEAMLTGESMPVEKNAGDSVTGGSLNLNGVLYIKVTKVGKDTALSKIISFVEEAQNKKAPISKVADKVSGIFVPVVIIIAAAAAVIWLAVGKDIAFALKVFTGVLFIACPCALGLATPTAVMVGTGLGASNGILIRNGEVLETTHKTKAAVFDKTGTVTVGKPTVTDVVSEDKNRMLSLAAGCEALANHPLSKAIVSYAEGLGISWDKPENFENISGKGIKATFASNEIYVGKYDFTAERCLVPQSLTAEAKRLSAEGKSVVYVSDNHGVLGIIALADELKQESFEAFDQLKKLGIKTVILSGDNRACAEYNAKLLGCDRVYSEVLPEQKAEIVNELKKEYGTVLMVGDGINDAPALTSADIGCAIGAGSDIAIESADIVLMHSDPRDVVKAIRLSRFTIRNIKQNLFWAFCYNAICIPVAAGLLHAFGGPLLSPMLAGLAMSFSSVCVVGNALRLRRKKL